MLLGFYGASLRKRIFTIWPFVLFGISIVLFLSVLIPNLLHRFPLPGEWPGQFELHGTVLIKASASASDTPTAIPGAKIEIGGYRTVTDQAGEFHIEFVSESSTDIPIVIVWPNGVTIERISFEPDQFEKTEVFVLNEE